MMEKEGRMEPAVCSGCMGCGEAMDAGAAGVSTASRSVNSVGMSTPRLSADASGLCHECERGHTRVSDQSDDTQAVRAERTIVERRRGARHLARRPR